jgi:hypothetical protein
MSKMRPHLQYTFCPAGNRDMQVYCLLIDDIALVGMWPEMDGITISQIRNDYPYKKMLAVTFVNGNAKSMPAKESYPLFHYTAINSPFAEGSAEITRDAVIELLNAESITINNFEEEEK